MSNSKKLGPNYPGREDMVRAAIYMERRGFSWEERDIMLRLCDSSKAIRRYILDYVQDMLDMWDGLKPSKGRFSDEIAYIAAVHAYMTTKNEMRHYSKERLLALLDEPAAWNEKEKEKARKAYQKKHPDNVRVTTKLKEALERETATVYHEPYTTESECTSIMFGIKWCCSAEKEEAAQ